MKITSRQNTRHGASAISPKRALHSLLFGATLSIVTAGGTPVLAQAPGGGEAPPIPVGVITVKPEQVGITQDLPGRVEASRIAQIRARATGIVEKRLFREGSDVQAGDVLYKLDSASYEAALNSAKASLARAQTAEQLATEDVQRYAPLLKANAVSRQTYANAVSARKQAQAEVGVARAAVKTAQINLSYTEVTSPISGRIGRSNVTEGALVSQTDVTQLATVQQIDPVYVNITQPASTITRMKRGLESGQLKQAGGEDGTASVNILFDDGTPHAHKGKLLFTDLTVDATTNQVTIRAEVPNPKGELLPGMYVRAQLEQASIPQAILLPQQAVTRTDAGDMVKIVSPDGKLSDRKITIGSSQGTNWVVVGGLQAGEQVMVDGFQALQMRGGPNAKIKAVPWSPTGSQPAGQPANAEAKQDAGN